MVFPPLVLAQLSLSKSSFRLWVLRSAFSSSRSDLGILFNRCTNSRRTSGLTSSSAAPKRAHAAPLLRPLGGGKADFLSLFFEHDSTGNKQYSPVCSNQSGQQSRRTVEPNLADICLIGRTILFCNAVLCLTIILAAYYRQASHNVPRAFGYFALPGIRVRGFGPRPLDSIGMVLTTAGSILLMHRSANCTFCHILGTRVLLTS